MNQRVFLSAIACLAACTNPATSGSMNTGLEGTIRLGPTQPVCTILEPCDAPLEAEFRLMRFNRVAAQFSSDSLGRYRVHIAPGEYFVVPVEPIGIGHQTMVVSVRTETFTHLDLVFDTGIR